MGLINQCKWDAIGFQVIKKNSYFLDLMPLAFQSRMSVRVRALPIVRKTEEGCKEGIEYDWTGAFIWVLHKF
jgi:hypothetical protein